MLFIVNPIYKCPEDSIIINTTSRSMTWSVGLSPFICGPCKLYKDYISKNIENGWQFTKVYKQLDHLDENNNPNDNYFKWAIEGWQTKKAIRYPAGRDAIPEYSYWNGEKLGYIKARKEIYIPLYRDAVFKTDAYKKLKTIYENMSDEQSLYLVCFDAHSLHPDSFTYDQLWNNENIKVGHAYVLGMMLEGKI